MRSNSTVLKSIATLLILFFAIVITSCSDKKNPVVLDESGPQLIVNVDSTLDIAGEIKVNLITSATLNDTTGAAIKNARISNGHASFGLTEINTGNYFIVINGLSQDRMPVRIVTPTDSTANIYQLVSRTLNSSLVIVEDDTLFRIRTFFLGQSGHPVRQFSDGANISPEEYAYAIESFGMMNANMEIRIDSTAQLLNRVNPPRQHEGGPAHPFPTWVLGELNHGRGPEGDPDSTLAQCGSYHCHSNPDSKPPEWSMIPMMGGYCYTCHYGSGGSSQGMLDPTK